MAIIPTNNEQSEMKVTSKKSITLAALAAHDEIVTYTIGSNIDCVKVRNIDGVQVFVLDQLRHGRFTSTQFATLGLLKAAAHIFHCKY